MPLAIFDLDNTLLHGDSDHGWGEFLITQSIVDGEQFRRTNDQFYNDYKRGVLDMAAYVAFALAPVGAMPAEQRQALHRQFMDEVVEAMILPKGEALLQHHRERGDTLMIITATNSFITGPIAARLGVPHLLATEPEAIDGRFTGRILGTPCFQAGKVTRLKEWLDKHGGSLEDSYFYSDSFNDLPLLEKVSFPFAVDPDPVLQAHAENHGWPVISLR